MSSSSSDSDRKFARRWVISGAFLWASLIVTFLLLGGVYPIHRAVSLLLVAAGLWVASYFSDDALARGGSAQHLLTALAAFPLALAVGWIPLPPSMLSIFAPGTAEAHPGQWWTLALLPWRVLDELAVMTLWMGFAWGISVWGAARRWARDVADYALQGLLAFLGVSALMHVALGAQSVFGVLSPSGPPVAFFAPLVNANHMGTVALLLMPLATLRAVEGWRTGASSRWLATIAAMSGAALIVGIGSPGVLVAGAVAVAMGAWILFGWFGKGLSALGSIVVAATIIRYWQFFEADWFAGAVTARLEQWRDSPKVLSAFWFAGTGGGGYEDAYLPISGVRMFRHFSHVHSDPQEWILETGLVGVLAFVFFWARLPRSATHRPSRGSTALSFGLLAALLHSFVDFPFQIPAVAMLFAGALSLRWTAFGYSRPTPPRKQRTLLRAFAVLAVLAAIWEMRVHLVRTDIEVAQRYSSESERAIGAASRLQIFAPWEPEIRLVSAWTCLAEGDYLCATTQAKQVCVDRPDHAKALRQAAIVLHKVEDFQSANEALERSYSRYPSDYRTLALRAEWSESGDSEVVASLWADALKHWPYVADGSPLTRGYEILPVGIWWLNALENAPPWWSLFLGQRMLREGDPETAVMAFEQTRRLYGARTVPVPDYALALDQIGRAQEADDYMESLSRAYPNDVGIIVGAARLDVQRGYHESASMRWLAAYLLMKERSYYALMALEEAEKVSSDVGLLMAERLKMSGNYTADFAVWEAKFELERGNPGACVSVLSEFPTSVLARYGGNVLLKQCLSHCPQCDKWGVK